MAVLHEMAANESGDARSAQPWRISTRAELLLYGITDEFLIPSDELIDAVQAAIDAGVSTIQLRMKHASQEEICVAAEKLAHICADSGVLFIVNDYVDIARMVHADGVHVGQDDDACTYAREILGPDAIVGVSVQTVDQARRACADGASYLGVGALIATSTKPDAVLVDDETLREICAVSSVPCVGIGGLNARTIPEFRGSGLVGAAVVSALFAHDEIADITRQGEKLLRVCEKTFSE